MSSPKAVSLNAGQLPGSRFILQWFISGQSRRQASIPGTVELPVACHVQFSAIPIRLAGVRPADFRWSRARVDKLHLDSK